MPENKKVAAAVKITGPVRQGPSGSEDLKTTFIVSRP
jgi:hypothetical protein